MIDIPNITRKRDLLLPNDAKFGMHRLRAANAIVGKRVEVGAGSGCDEFFVPGFVDCDVRLCGNGSRTQVATGDLQFHDCQIWAKKKQNMANWEAKIERCYFRGTYALRFAGRVTDCDFSQARLLHAVFLQTEPLGSVVWPKWPHVVVENPGLNYLDWSQIPKPPEFNDYLVRKDGVATVFDLSDKVEDPEAFWQRIQHCPYVHSQR